MKQLALIALGALLIYGRRKWKPWPQGVYLEA